MAGSEETFDYEQADIVNALKVVGVEKGDNIFIHSNIGFFGKLKDGSDARALYAIYKKAIFEVIGDEGTLVVPTFTYSFCWSKDFDIEKTPSTCGMLSELVRKDEDSIRSADANFSVAAIGKNAENYTKNPPEHTFGPDSFWERFLKSGGKFCNLNFDSASTFFHYTEKVLKVPYRYDKGFPGKTISADGSEREGTFYHFVFDLEKPNNGPEFTKFDKRARELGLAKTADLGRGQVVLITASDTFELIEKEFKVNPAFLIKGDKIEV